MKMEIYAYKGKFWALRYSEQFNESEVGIELWEIDSTHWELTNESKYITIDDPYKFFKECVPVGYTTIKLGSIHLCPTAHQIREKQEENEIICDEQRKS